MITLHPPFPENKLLRLAGLDQETPHALTDPLKNPGLLPSLIRKRPMRSLTL